MIILDTSKYGLLIFFAWVAQLVERLICNERVGSSSLSAGAIIAVLLSMGQVQAAGNTMSAAEEGNRAIPGD